MQREQCERGMKESMEEAERGRQHGNEKHAMNTTTTTLKNNKYKTHNNQTIENFANKYYT